MVHFKNQSVALTKKKNPKMKMVHVRVISVYASSKLDEQVHSQEFVLSHLKIKIN